MCSDGKLDCPRPQCPQEQCGSNEEFVLVPGLCCPVCIPSYLLPAIDPPFVPQPECQEGETTVDESNPCMECTCSNGRRACVDKSGACPRDASDCEPTETLEAVEGQCCSWRCVELPHPIAHPLPAAPQPPPSYGLSQYYPFHRQCETEGEYIDPQNPCRRCSCYNGREACVNIAGQCKELSCQNTKVPEGECCPVCIEEPTLPPTTPPTNPPPEACHQEGEIKHENCMECLCFLGEFHCFPDTTRCGPGGQMQSDDVPMHHVQSDDVPMQRCRIGEMRRMENCMRCRCNDGFQFTCFFDPTLCPPMPSQDKAETGASDKMKVLVSSSQLQRAKAVAAGKGRSMEELVNKALGEAGVQVLAIETTYFNRYR